MFKICCSSAWFLTFSNLHNWLINQQSIKLSIIKQKKLKLLLDVDDYEDCAEQIHQKCASKMANDFNKDSRMCYGVRNFVSCYNNPGTLCKAKIYKDFNHTLQRLANLLLKLFEENPGTMPNCWTIPTHAVSFSVSHETNFNANDCFTDQLKN